MRVIAFIPARERSKRIIHKNMKEFNGEPLIFWTINSAINSGIFDEIIVNTDWYKVKDFVKNTFGDKVIIQDRDRWMGDDHIQVRDLISEYCKEENIWVLLHPTSPLRTAVDIYEAYNYYRSKGLKTLHSVNRYTYKRNGAVDIFRQGQLFLEQPFDVYLMDPWVIDIDTEDDFIMAEAIHRDRKNVSLVRSLY